MLRILLRSLALVAAVVAILAAVQIILVPEAPSTPYEAPDRLILKDENSTDYREIVTLEARTPITGVTFRRDDGVVVDVYASGSISHTEEYWPPTEDGYVPKRVADYGANDLLLKEQLFRKDGTLEQSGERSADRSWIQQVLDKDGTTLLVSTVFAGPGQAIVTETQHDANGEVILFAEMEDGWILHVVSRKNGLVLESWEDSTGIFHLIEYAEGGQLWKEWRRVGFTTELTVYAEDGAVASTQVWDYDGRLEVKQFRPDGSLALRQVWRPTTTAGYGIALSEVELAIGASTFRYSFGSSAGDFTIESPQMFGYKLVRTYDDWFWTKETIIYPDGQRVTREIATCACTKPQLPEVLVKMPELWKLPLVTPLTPPSSSDSHGGNYSYTPKSPFAIQSSPLYQKRGP